MDNDLELFYVMASDDDFQKILKDDEVLKKLEQEKYSKRWQYFQLMSVISKKFKIRQLSVTVITPVIWSLLFCLGNRYVVHNQGEIRNKDTDVFLYILHNGITSISENLFEMANGFCIKNNIPYDFAKKQLFEMIYIAFRPLEMFPVIGINDQDVRFNLDWLTKIVAMVCELTNRTSQDVMYNMSLTEVLSFVVQSCRRNDPDNQIKRRNAVQIEAEIYKRTLQLGKEYYNKNYKNKE